MKADFVAAGAPATTPIFTEETYFAADMFIQALKTVVKKSGAKGITPEPVHKVLATQPCQINEHVGPTKDPAATAIPSPAAGNLLTSTATTPWPSLPPSPTYPKH